MTTHLPPLASIGPPRPEASEADEASERSPDGPPGSASPDSSMPATLRVIAWEDPVVERFGLDPRSRYVERFWLPVLGPSSTWLLRRLADGLDSSPAGFELELEEAGRSLGLGGAASRHSPLRRSIQRCCRYGMATRAGAAVLRVRRKVAPVPPRLLMRLPVTLQEEHRRWVAATAMRSSGGGVTGGGATGGGVTGGGLPRTCGGTTPARRLAASMLATGEDRDVVERHLLRRGMHPAVAFDAVRWAAARRAPRTDTGAPEPNG